MTADDGPLLAVDERAVAGADAPLPAALRRAARARRICLGVLAALALAGAFALPRARPAGASAPPAPRLGQRSGGRRSGKTDDDAGGGERASSKPKSFKHHALPSDPTFGPPDREPAWSRPSDLPLVDDGGVPEGGLPAVNDSAACHWQSYRLPTDVLPLAYNLTIELGSLDVPSMVYGSVEIELARNASAKRAPRCVVLHVAPELTVHSLRVTASDGADLGARVARYAPEWSQLHVELGAPLRRGATLAIAFSYELRDKLTGLYHSRFTGTDGAEHSIATTQHEATSARETFPCWDEPAFKATFALTLHVPSADGNFALSNMPALSASALADGGGRRGRDETLRAGRPLVPDGAPPLAPRALKRVVFGRSPRMSTYLVAFVVGQFESIEATSESGVQLKAWAPAASEQLGKLRYALAIARKALDLYEALFDVPFPLPKIDIVSIPDFGPGAMENWGLITYRATSVLADEHSSPYDRQSVACTVVHELGHQWTGNLVTMEWWDELWLNEGFANYFEQAVTAMVEPSLMLDEQHVQYLSTALHFDGSPDTHAVRPARRVASDSAVGALFDSISYDKAGAVIYMLHDYLQRKVPGAFVKGLKSYFNEHSYGSASGSDMWRHLTKASGLPIAANIEPWFAQAGYPLIEVTTLSDGSAVVLQTGRFMQDLTRTQMAFSGEAGGDQAATTISWWVPISYFTSTAETVRVGEIASTSAFFSIPPPRKHLGGYDIDGTDWLKVNFNGAGYYRVNYAPHLWARLVAAAEVPGRLSDADLSNLIDDAFALTLNGRLSGVMLSLARALGVRTAHETSLATASYESWASMSIGLRLFLALLGGAAHAHRGPSRPGLTSGPGVALIPHRCLGDLQRFVRTQVLGRCLDPMLETPATGAPADADADADDDASGGVSDERRSAKLNQLEALARPVLISLAALMADERVDLWVMKAFEPCLDAPDAKCDAIDRVSPELRSTLLSICARFDRSGRCWRLAHGQLAFAATDPAYRYALLSAMAAAPSYALFNRTLAMSLEPASVRAQDVDAMIAMLAANSALPEARQIVWEFVKRNVDTLIEAGGGKSNFGYGSVLSHVAGGFASEEMAQDVELFLARNPTLDVPERIVHAVVGRIRSQAIWVQNYGADTCTVLESWHA